MSSIFYYLRSPPKCSLKCLLRRLTVPILYIIIDHDNTVTYRCDGWSSDSKGIQAIPFEVIPLWILNGYNRSWARRAQYLDVNVVIRFRISKWSSFRYYPEINCRKELKMVMEAFRINIVISRLTESWCSTPSHSRRLCQSKHKALNHRQRSYWQTMTLDTFFTTVVIDCQQHAQLKHKLSNQKSDSIYLTLKPTFPFSVPTQISSVPFSSFLRPIGLSGRHKGRFRR